MRIALPVIAVFAATAFANPAHAASKTFNGPTQHNMPIDQCMHFGGPCGQATANAFCKAKGFKLANKFTLMHGTQKTVYLGGAACVTRTCNGFASIACSDSLNVQAGSSTDIGSVGD